MINLSPINLKLLLCSCVILCGPNCRALLPQDRLLFSFGLFLLFDDRRLMFFYREPSTKMRFRNSSQFAIWMTELICSPNFSFRGNRTTFKDTSSSRKWELSFAASRSQWWLSAWHNNSRLFLEPNPMWVGEWQRWDKRISSEYIIYFFTLLMTFQLQRRWRALGLTTIHSFFRLSEIISGIY